MSPIRSWFQELTPQSSSQNTVRADVQTKNAGQARLERSQEDLQRIEDLTQTGAWILVGLIVGLCVVLLRYAFEFLLNGFTQKNWHATGLGFSSLLWSLAWLIAGFLLGFLFGIPKASGVQTAAAKDGSTDKTGATQKSEQWNGSETPYQLRVNTNLEEISDWLTKILVGATLTQLAKIPGWFVRATEFMTKGSPNADSAQAFAGGILLFFSTLGFFAGYVLTRMFFSGAFTRSDPVSLQTSRIVRNLGPVATPTGDTTVDDAAHDPQVLRSAQDSTQVPITTSLSGAELSALAKGALIVGDASRAVLAASIAISKSPLDPMAHLDYAIALHQANSSSTLILQEVEKVRAAVPPTYSASLKEDIFNSLVYLCLYQDKPSGFLKAIQLGEEFVHVNAPQKASIWINLACAYGQLYQYIKEGNDKTGTFGSLDNARDKATNAVNRAITLRSESRARLKQIAQGDGEDDDLVVLYQSEELFRKALDETNSKPAGQ